MSISEYLPVPRRLLQAGRLRRALQSWLPARRLGAVRTVLLATMFSSFLDDGPGPGGCITCCPGC